MRQISAQDLAELCVQAHEAIRKRAHMNLHESLNAPVQRLFISLQPDTYIRPHRHPESNKWEQFVLIQGALDLLTFHDDGRIRERIRMSSDAARAVVVPAGDWHTYICQRPDTVALEIKEGPYIATDETDFGPWSPVAESAQVPSYLERLRQYKT